MARVRAVIHSSDSVVVLPPPPSGKYIKLQYGADWKLGGARTLPFLLEKSRLVHQEHNERNYHVFYQLCKGVSETFVGDRAVLCPCCTQVFRLSSSLFLLG